MLNLPPFLAQIVTLINFPGHIATFLNLEIVYLPIIIWGTYDVFKMVYEIIVPKHIRQVAETKEVISNDEVATKFKKKKVIEKMIQKDEIIDPEYEERFKNS